MTTRKARRGARAGSRLASHWTLAALVAVLVLVALVRLRVADVPLDRDEGEYAYAGQLILQGIAPYRLAYNMKFPGAYYAYAAILAAFGQTAWGVHVGLLVVNAATSLVLFFLGRRLIGAVPALIGATAFAILSLDRAVYGVFASATHFVLLPALAGLLVLLRAIDSGRPGAFALAGALLGTSVLMKQHAIVFVPLGVVLAIRRDLWRSPRDVRRIARRSGLLLAGALAPFLVLCAVLLTQGVLGRFWFWTFAYAKEYVTIVPLAAARPLFERGFGASTRITWLFWLMAGLGLATLALPRWKAETRGFLLGLLVASALAVCPGLYFRPHYFVLLFPAVALLVGVAVASIAGLLARWLPSPAAWIAATAVFAAVAGHYVITERRYLLSMGVDELSRDTYGLEPFLEASEIARYVRERTDPREPIAVVGSEPEIYFYADRKSATGYIYTYALMEPQRYAARMQDEMIREIETARPVYLILVETANSWSVRPTSDQKILEWAGRYARACYRPVGVVDVHSPVGKTILWEGDMRGYTPRSRNLVYTFRRTSDAPCSPGTDRISSALTHLPDTRDGSR